MICVYESTCTDFSSNGLGVLSPESAEVSETLNGEYELMLVHPMDEMGKWSRLAEDRIIRAPVPASMTPALMSSATVSTAKEIYKVTTNRDPLRLRSGTGTNYRIISKYKKGTEVIVLDKSNSSWYEVSCPDGKRGYMYASYLTYQRTITTGEQAVEEIIEPRRLRDQPFRIYRIVPELNKVTVYARHIFYDLLDNMVKKYEPSASTTGSDAVQALSAACEDEHPFTFYSDLTSTAEEVKFENKNPIDCILGDEGIIGKYGGELVRDWYDAFVVQRVGTDTNIQIREGKNLLGIKYDLDMTNVATRIMPTGQDKDGNVLYLPEVYVDSPNINLYAHPKWMHMEVSEAKEVTAKKDKKTKNQCYADMRNAVQAEYDKGCDMPDITLTVDFINVTDTEEYRQYAFLQNIFLGDTVRVITKRLKIAVSMRMTDYKYDCLKRKYTKMTLGTVADTVAANIITSRQLPSGIITGSKLAINAVGPGALQGESIGSAHIQAAAIEIAHIQSAAIAELSAQAIQALTAYIGEITAQTIETNQLSANLAEVFRLIVNKVTADAISAETIETDTLMASLAEMVSVSARYGDFNFATVQHLVASAMNIQQAAVAGRVFIENLDVAYAQMVDATISNLVVKSSEGDYYRLDVSTDGSVTATQVTVAPEEREAGHTTGGRAILDTDIAAVNLSTANLLATYALVNQIDAARIDVAQLFAQDAFIQHLNTTDISSNTTVQIVTRIAQDASAAAAEAQDQADAATIIANALENQLKLWFTFDSDLGFIVQKMDENGQPVSIWSTVTDEVGYHIRRADLEEYVFSAYRDRVRVQKLEIGDIMIKASSAGGHVWTRR